MKRKTFDCVVMKRRGAERIRRTLEGKTPEETRRYWMERTEALRRRQQQLQQAQSESSPRNS